MILETTSRCDLYLGALSDRIRTRTDDTLADTVSEIFPVYNASPRGGGQNVHRNQYSLDRAVVR